MINKYLNSFRMGCDPEFVALKSAGAPVNVNTIVAQPKGPFGSDHNGRVVELHPEPSRSVYVVVRNLRELITNGPLALQEYRWRAGGVYSWDYCDVDPRIAGPGQVAMGGHIHIGLKNDTWIEKTAAIQAMDQLTRLMEQLELLPSGEMLRRRTSTPYGQYGATKVSGADLHLEYRTMCSWLYDPKIAMLAMTGAKIASVFPKESLEYLKKPASRGLLQGYFDAVRVPDRDVQRVQEKVPLGLIVAEPDRDLKVAWKALGLT